MALVVEKPAQEMQETWVRSLGWEDPLEEEMVVHSSILAWKIPWTEEPGELLSTGSQSVRHNWTQSYKRTDYCSCVNCFLPLLWLFFSSFFPAVFHKDLLGCFWWWYTLILFSLYFWIYARSFSPWSSHKISLSYKNLFEADNNLISITYKNFYFFHPKTYAIDVRICFLHCVSF